MPRRRASIPVTVARTGTNRFEIRGGGDAVLCVLPSIIEARKTVIGLTQECGPGEELEVALFGIPQDQWRLDVSGRPTLPGSTGSKAGPGRQRRRERAPGQRKSRRS